MNYLLTPAEELASRLNKIQKQLFEQNLDGALITKNVDIYYYSGTMQNSILFIPVKDSPILFVKKSVERAKKETPYIVEELTSIKIMPSRIESYGNKIARLGIDMDVIPLSFYQRIENAFQATLFSDISPVIRMQRSVKSEFELDLLKQSARVLNEAILEIPNIIKPGIRELDLTSSIEKFVRDRGHLGYIRTRTYNMELVLGMVASGVSAALPTSFDGPAGGEGLTPAMPQSSGYRIIKENEPIIIDIAAAVNGYIIDQTRMAVIGKLDPELEYAYQVSLNILKETEKNAKEGTTWSEHYLNALEIVKEAGLEKNFMGYGHDQAKFLGHGVGLELDELPVIAKGLDYRLESGMVIAIEPKFTFPNKGVIGIENTYVVTAEGLIHLSFAPENIIYL